MTAPLEADEAEPLLRVHDLSHRFPSAAEEHWAVRGASLVLHPGEVVAIVGESGSGKSTLLNCVAGRIAPSAGQVQYRRADGRWVDVHALPERERRELSRTEWGFVEQHAAEGLRMNVSAGANVGERLMALGRRHYGELRATACEWMERVELDPMRVDDSPRAFSGGMRQRLQIARNLVTRPRLVLMDEPTTGLDVSVQAKLLDLIRLLVARLHLSALVVTHDLGVARLLAHRTLVMRQGRIVEQGLTDRVLEDPQHPYTQLLVSSVVAP
ncbi:phosphonate C-P lyase system protein PhnK [Pseudothauera rhizosphaerae]|uniref:Phosphonate C-P lyase system protein PhnK n=1 Tax=Pseudothauera rhizosphaerae TaxID=2565932 RepID=A0A4S4AIQ7_9RHOO|nr:phosphonate C-P lyase system protein PhnK [Pseudothauera rhizosphaerae]THF59247.1 phosphonate C-P lyase system protein PhnK [Pseudothauera rhizosphaerae]